MTTQEQPAIQIPPIPQWLHGRMDDPAFRVKFLKPNGAEHFVSNVGPQTWGLLCPFEEMTVGGRRGGGKSRFLIASFAMGDPELPDGDPAKYSFLNDRDFRGLLLREEYQSMAEFVEEAIEFYKPFGGKPTGNPKQIDFPKVGSRIYFNHLGDEEAFSKYKGWNLTKIGVEELTQIKTLRQYLKLLGSLRSVERVRNGKRYPALRTQIISTTNPDGPGREWVMQRFVKVYGGGRLIPWNTPMRDPISGMIRIFIPFGIEDNPYLAEHTPAGRRYRAMLMAQDEVTRKQWMFGDWDAGSGRFFSEYRPDGPIGEEERDKHPWANHVIKSAALKPWWYRWGSADTGWDHPSAYHKFCRNEQDKRVHVYDEMQLRQVSYFEQGALLAKWWHPELIEMQRCGSSPSVTVHMGADAFSKTDITKTKAEQIAAGIQEVLGPYGALLLKYNEDEKEVMLRDPKRAQTMFDRRKQELGDHMHIALKPVYVDRIAAWGYVRDMLRFRPAVLPLQTPEEREQYLRDVLNTEGHAAYELQSAELRNIKPEILPKLQIWMVCRELDRCLKVAVHDTRADNDPAKVSKREDVLKFNADESGLNGDDALEGFRNGIIAFKEIETTIPQGYWVRERIAEVQQDHVAAFGEQITDPTRLAMIAMRQNALYGQQYPKTGGTLTFPRAGASLHRGVN